MLRLILALIPLALVVSLVLTWLARALGQKMNAMDAQGVSGQVKAAVRRVPNTGGIAVFWTMVLPLAALLVLLGGVGVDPGDFSLVPADLQEHLRGLAERATAAWVLLGALAVLHVVGLIDDRRPLPAMPKLVLMLVVAGLASWITDTRLLTVLDPMVGGAWLSIGVTVVWLVVVTNAFNFLDNMDGLSPGVAMLCASFFLAATLGSAQPQWFIGACLALMVGGLLGFLCFNFPFTRRGATIFLGDSGSLVVGFLLAFLAVRLTYLPLAGAGEAASESHVLSGLLSSAALPALFTPLVILAIPLYDFVSVCVIRLSQGKSPFVGDLQHFSHRLVGHGLSRRAAVLVIYGCTVVTAIGGLLLPLLTPAQSLLIAVQTVCVLGVLAAYEWARTP